MLRALCTVRTCIYFTNSNSAAALDKEKQMTKSRIYYPETTKEQRYRLFEVWEKTGNINLACEKARVSRSTFYYWKDRFERGGYAAIAKHRSNAPKNPRHTPPDLVERIKTIKQKNPTWGKERIAREVARIDPHGRTVGSSTVRRVLMREKRQ
ncbi:MAG: helix-turn-helix domain containing protein [Caldilineaceae bacterium]|nr:helix-turn-helix domain containing protein [Caldilineaceae bacterium]MCB9157610.1 helix-turn-helix domain containing protein [Caldilineaceae bacterium]